MIPIKRFYFVNEPGHTLVIKSGLSLGPMPLIWENAGLYGLLRREKMENILQELADNKLTEQIEKKRMVLVHWDEVEIIDPKIGKLLVG